MPLPRPDKKTKTAPIPVPKRKPIPPPNLSPKPPNSEGEHTEARKNHPLPPPLLPKRRSRETEEKIPEDDGLLVVAAPESEPTTPGTEHQPSYLQPWVDDVDEESQEIKHQPVVTVNADPPDTPLSAEAPRLPRRAPSHRVMSSSPEEDGPKLPSWLAAQEEEARAKSTFVDEDAGI